MKQLATSLDGQWAAARDGRTVVLLAAGAQPAVGRLELDDDDCDLVFVGPPDALVAVVRGATPKVVLYQLPYLEAVARLDLERPMRLAAVTGPRFALLSADGKQLVFVRAAPRALTTQSVDVGGPVEFAVGLERNQVLIGMTRKLEVWDAVSGRPMLKLQLQLPPPPRTIGAAAGHLWVTRPSSDEVFVYRLSDGRPFRHYVGAQVDEVTSHPASPLLVLATPRGLVRLHCFAHSLTLLDQAPWSPAQPVPLAQLVSGDDISLLGLDDSAGRVWRIAIGGAGAPASAPEPEPELGLVTAADRLRAMRGAGHDVTTEPTAPTRTATATRAWREGLVGFGQELARGVDGDPPVVPVDTELGELAHRLALSSAARRALTALYALHLVGEPQLAISRLARTIADWTEPLGQGDLAELAMVRRKEGRLALRAAVTDLLDGAAPRAIRLVGGDPQEPRAGAFRVSRDGRSDATIEAELAAQLGRIAIVDGRLSRALLEARLHGATAIAMTVPAERPKPWPRGAGLVLVLYGAASAWVADVPAL